MSDHISIPANENQARAIGQYAIDFLSDGYPDPNPSVLDKVEQFHTDSVVCAVSAIALRANAPTVLRNEALTYVCGDPVRGVTCFGSTARVQPEKAVAANCSAVREWDANGTNFGYDPQSGNTRGEFGHNDYYPVAVAAAQLAGLDGRHTLRAMLCLDEIRGRLAEVFALRDHKIDHVTHGAIASAAVYGATLGANADQIESAIGMVVAHYIPFRAIRAGRQLSDSKGASAALSSEVAVLSMRRAMNGFVGPADIFRNPQAIFCLFEPPAEADRSPFDLRLTTTGNDFAIIGMHFKIGLYEHQSAGAIEGLMSLLTSYPEVLDDPQSLQRVRIAVYEPAFSVIGDPAKRDPRTRQSADHSMVYIVATVLRKAFQSKQVGWEQLMLMPEDYDDESLFHPETRRLMETIEFVHGGPEYDALYPDGIPTSLEIDHARLGTLSSGLVMYPEGHARNTSGNLDRLLSEKFRRLAALGTRDVDGLKGHLSGLVKKSSAEIQQLYNFTIEGA